MALTYGAMNALKAIAKIGIPQADHDWLAQSGLTVTLKPGKLTISDDQGFSAEVAVTLTQLQKLSQGSLAPSEKGMLGHKIVSVIAAAKKHLPNKGVATGGFKSSVASFQELPKKGKPFDALKVSLKVDDDAKVQAITVEDGKPKVAGPMASLPPLDVAKSVPVTDILFPRFPANKQWTAPVVLLRDAKFLYQPVAGTSANSRYFLVAASLSLRIAARLEGHTLSIRIEGTDPEILSKFSAKVAAAGFDKSGSKHYASLHLSVGSDLVLASKALGAVIAGLGLQMKTPVPQLSALMMGGS